MKPTSQAIDAAFCASYPKSSHGIVTSLSLRSTSCKGSSLPQTTPHFPAKKTTLQNKYARSDCASLFATVPEFSGLENIIHDGAEVSGNKLTSLLMADVGDVQGYASSMSPTTTEFEPIVNVPSLVSFVIIAVVFSLLQFRINAISGAAERRTNALAELRKVKSLQLSSSSSAAEDASEKDTTEDNINNRVRKALIEYETALTEEMELRSIAPGIRIVAPNDPKKMEEDVAAAKQFLGWDLLQEDGEEESGEKDGNTGSLSKSSKETANPMSNASVAILGFIGVVLAFQLFVLQFDPMTANNVFTSVEGVDPPMDMPLRSW